MVFIATASADQNKVQNSQLIGRIEGGGGIWRVGSKSLGSKSCNKFPFKRKKYFLLLQMFGGGGGLIIVVSFGLLLLQVF